MSYASLKAPEELAAAMLAECPVWRGLVAYPDLTWDELASILDAETLDEGEASERIAIGALQEQWDDVEHLPRPRASVRQLDEGDASRDSTSTFSDLSGVHLTIEFPVPPSLLSSPQAAFVDLRRKAEAITYDLASLSRQAGRLDIERIGKTPDGLADMKAYPGQEPFAVMQRALVYRGSVP